MNTLSTDLLGLIDKHLDAFSSVRLAISSNISMFFEGCDTFNVKKQPKWLVFAIGCKESNAFNDALDDYDTLAFLDTYNQCLLTPNAYRIDHRIKSVRFHYILKTIERRDMELLMSLLTPEKENISTLMHCVYECIRIGWLEGVKVLDPIYKRLSDAQVLNIGEFREYDSVLLIDAYKSGSNDIIQYYENIFTDELFDDPRYDRLVGMLSSSTNYEQNPLYIDLLAELAPQTKEKKRMRKNIIISLLDEKASNEKIFIILSLFNGETMNQKLKRLVHTYDIMEELLDAVFRNDNLELATMLVDILIELKNDQTREQLAKYVFECSIDRNMLLIYQKIFKAYPYFKPQYDEHIDWTTIDTIKILFQTHGQPTPDELQLLIALAFERGRLDIFGFLCTLI